MPNTAASSQPKAVRGVTYPAPVAPRAPRSHIADRKMIHFSEPQRNIVEMTIMEDEAKYLADAVERLDAIIKSAPRGRLYKDDLSRIGVTLNGMRLWIQRIRTRGMK